MEIMSEHKITPSAAMKIYKSGQGDINHILEVYNYCKDKQANNFVGLIIHMVKPGEFNQPKRTIKKNSFFNFEQRSYDYDDLEKELLGWDE